MSRPEFARAVLVAVCLLACTPRSEPPPPPPTPQNLILISLDTLRADHLGMFGYERDTSPNLDRLAAESVLFRRAVAQANSTIPSHGSLLTSLYYSAFEAEKGLRGPPDTADTLAEILRGQGFETWAFVDGGNMRRLFGFSQGFDHFEDKRVGIERLVTRAEKWVETHRAERFFLFLHTYDIHTPYAPPPPYDRMFVDPSYDKRFKPNTKLLRAIESGRLSASAADLDYIVASYDGGVRYTDDVLGGFFAWLERTGLRENTLVVIFSDHGEEFLEHGRFGHEQIFLFPNLHVPLIVAAPGRAPRVVDETVELVDVLPTILELLELPPHPTAQGRSLVPHLSGSAPDRDEAHAYAEPTARSSRVRTVITDRYQLLYDVETGRELLLDLSADPSGKTDVSKDEPEVAARLRSILHRRMAESKRRNSSAASASSSSDEAPELDADTRRELEALGYIDADPH